MAREALRTVFASGCDDPYEHVEMDVATRLGGAMLVIMAIFAGVATPLTPPHDAAGVAAVVLFIGATLGAGITVLRRDLVGSSAQLLGAVYLALVGVAAYRGFAGDGVPLEQLLFVITVSACVIHPVGTSLVVLASATAIAWSPLLYQPLSAAATTRTVNQLVLIWCFGLIAVAWMARVRRQRREAAAASALARIDALTGLQNRRALEEFLPAQVHHHRRHNRPLSVLVADLDDFKGINDTHGHQAGDDMLRKVAQSLTAALRLSDPCYRWGGDEFVAVLPEAAFGEATDIAARVRETVALSCRTPDGRPLRITVGAAQLGPGQGSEDLLAAADAVLLEGKARRKAGRAAVA